MAEATLRQITDEWPDISGLITEDDTPVDNIFSEKQQRMLTLLILLIPHNPSSDSYNPSSDNLMLSEPGCAV